jgi:hypothetical protein
MTRRRAFNAIRQHDHLAKVRDREGLQHAASQRRGSLGIRDAARMFAAQDQRAEA